MGKENLRHSSTEFESYGLKWEFMRRDPKYQSAYKEYFNDDGSIKNKDQVREMLYLFAMEFQIFWPIQPNISFLTLRKNLYQKSKTQRREKLFNALCRMKDQAKTMTKKYEYTLRKFKASIEDICAIDHIYDQLTFWIDGVWGSRKKIKAMEIGLEQEDIGRILSIIQPFPDPRWTRSVRDRTREINVTIDIDAPLERILAAVKHEIYHTKYFLNFEHEQKGTGKTRRRNKTPESAVKLLQYLNAYICMKEKALNYRKTAKELYPEDFKSADGIQSVEWESLEDRLRTHVQKAEKYIGGGYREIK